MWDGTLASLVLFVGAGAVWMWDGTLASPRQERKALTGPGRGRRKHPNRPCVLLASFQKNRETRGTRDFTDTSLNTVPRYPILLLHQLLPSNGLHRPFRLDCGLSSTHRACLFQSQTASTGHSDVGARAYWWFSDYRFNPKRALQAIPTWEVFGGHARQELFQSQTGSTGHSDLTCITRMMKILCVSIPNGLHRPFRRRLPVPPYSSEPLQWHLERGHLPGNIPWILPGISQD